MSLECESARVEPGKKNRIHVVWLSERFGVKAVYMVNTRKWIVISRHIGFKFSANLAINVHPSALSYYLKKGTVAILSYVRKSVFRPREPVG
jgi:hypothetical protein